MQRLCNERERFSGDGKSYFAAPKTFSDRPTQRFSRSCGDINNDGKLDLVVRPRGAVVCHGDGAAGGVTGGESVTTILAFCWAMGMGRLSRP